MCSDEDTPHNNDSAHARYKKNRRLRACDACRRRKVRCDGADMPENTCSNCITFKYKCTYLEGATRRTVNTGYVENLETQLAETRKTLEKYCVLYRNGKTDNAPKSAPSTDAQTPAVPATAGSRPRSPVLQDYQEIVHACTMRHNQALATMSELALKTKEIYPSDEEVTSPQTLVKGFGDTSFYKHDHFLGKSSGWQLIRTAIDMREGYEGAGPERLDDESGKKLQLLGERRPVFWSGYSWVERRKTRKTPHFVFPDDDLIDALVSAYFTESNLYLPLLHRPTFEQSVRDGMHYYNANFGCVLLLVCALGAQYSDDPRVLLDDQPPGARATGTSQEAEEEQKWKWHSAGWKWFMQVQEYKNFLELSQPTLADLQMLCLAILFTQSSPHSAWVYIGVGVRFAQELGAHRRQVHHKRSSVESELLKRAFWILLFLDRSASSALGRPCGIHDEDIDIDLPIACDDDYWINADPDLAFKQPEGKPSTVTYFNCALRLAQIHAFALRTIYSINKSKTSLGFVGPQWEQYIVAELDSTLNKWIDSVPDHLRWNPHMENHVFLSQSALLYASYYALQITIHRPFIPSPRKPSTIPFPSLAICTNAARSCVHVLDVCAKSVGRPSFLSQIALFNAGIVLLMNIWGAKRSGSIADPVKEMKEVHKAMDLFKMLEARCYTAGRSWDILYSLVNIGNLPLPTSASRKRARSSEGAAEPSLPSGSAALSDDARPIAGTRRVQLYQQQASVNADVADPFSMPGDFTGSLPIHSDELGRLPLYPFFDADPGPSANVASEPLYPQVVLQGEPAWPPSSFDNIPYPSGQSGFPPASTHVQGEPLDAASFEAIFSMLRPASYQPAEAPSAPAPQNAGPSYPQDLTSVLNENLGNMVPQMDALDVQGDTVNSFEDGALAMWSSAPTGFEWDDWSTYVNTVGQQDYT